MHLRWSRVFTRNVHDAVSWLCRPVEIEDPVNAEVSAIRDELQKHVQRREAEKTQAMQQL
jgi:hypothetical protein